MLRTFLTRRKEINNVELTCWEHGLIFCPWAQKGLGLSFASSTVHLCDLGHVITSLSIRFLTCKGGGSQGTSA